MTSSSTESSKRRLNPALLGVGVFCLLGGLAAAYLINRSADLPDSSPALERQGLNAPFITTPDLVVDTMVELAEIKGRRRGLRSGMRGRAVGDHGGHEERMHGSRVRH